MSGESPGSEAAMPKEPAEEERSERPELAPADDGPLARRLRRISIALSVGVGGLYFALALGRYYSFHNQTFDLAFYARIAWTMIRGGRWEPMLDAHIFGLHLMPVLEPLGLLGMLFGNVHVLLFAQALAVSLTAWPLARLGRRKLGTWGILAGAVAWLLYPNIGQVIAYEFHPGTLAALPLTWALVGLDEEDPKLLFWGSFGVLLCREDLALAVLCLASLAFLRGGRMRKVGLYTGSFALLYLLYFLLLLHPLYAPPQGSLELHFARWGSSIPEILLYLLGHPMELVEHFLLPRRATYLPKILAPLLLLPLLKPRWLWVAAPVLATNLISAFPTTTNLDSHYLTPALPALLVGALDGAGALKSWLAPRISTARAKKLPARIAQGMIAASLVAYVVASAMPGSIGFPVERYTADEDTEAIAAMLAQIPEDQGVQGPDSLLPHLAERQQIRRGPPPDAAQPWVILDARHRRRFLHREDLLRTDEEPTVRNWLAKPSYGLLAIGGGYLLLHRGLDPREGMGMRARVGEADPEEGERVAACLALLSTELEGSNLTLEFVAREACPADLAIRLGTGSRPRRVDLLFDGLLSPAHLRRGDRLRSGHPLDEAEQRALRAGQLRVGGLRSSGARPEHGDPVSIPIALTAAVD